MGEWTDFERATIKNTFAKIHSEVVGPDALTRCLLVYPLTKKHFEKFGNLSNADAIRSNPNVTAHGKVVLDALTRAAQNLDNIKATYAELRVLHSEKLKLAPDNLRLLTDCITVAVAVQLGKDFTPEVHAAFQKFIDVVVSSLGKQHH